MVSATVAGAALGGPLLGVMGFSFLATLTLVLVTSPLLLIFSPLLLCAAFLLAGALTGFALAAAMAFAGLCALSWSSKEVVKCLQFIGERVEEHGRDFGGHLQQIVHDDNSPEFARLIPVE
ncbi:oleosin 5-like [Pistacia vera]|uniref:oleosin 5-like n=1 Tax=Pistacia vera TaxID=55513 RepID=UPI0012630C16|nr:oleosin 5-like [Pistacia vera]